MSCTSPRIVNPQLRPNTESEINKFSSVVGCGRSSFLKGLNIVLFKKLHSSPGDIVKNQKEAQTYTTGKTIGPCFFSCLITVWNILAYSTYCIY
jgi:hypothetical protein